MIPGFPKIYSILLVLSIRVLTAGANVMDTIHLNDYVDGDNDCDVQIFYSDITSDKQGSGRHSTHPTTISRTILQKNFPSNWMDVNITGSAVREVAEYRSLLFLRHKERPPIMITCATNVYIVVITTMKLWSEREKIFQNKRTFYNYIAFIFYSRDNTRFCVVPTALSRVQCEYFERTRDSVVVSFKALTSAPEYWILNGFSVTTGRGLIATRGNLPNLGNPFANDSTLKALVSLARIAFHQANLTILEIPIRGIIPNEAYISVHQFDRVNLIGSRQIVVSKFVGYKFLTCYTEQFITFYFYVTPFKLEVWIGLLAAILIFVLGNEVSNKFTNFGKSSFSAWLFILANMFEEGGFVPKCFEKSNFFRLTFGFWGLMALILTNCYTGLMISELNAPLRGNVPTIFQDLVCSKGYNSESYGKARADNLTTVWFQKHFGNFMQFWVHNGAYDVLRIPRVKRRPQPSRNCFTLLSPPNEYAQWDVPTYKFFTFLYVFANRFHYLGELRENLSAQTINILSLLDPKHGHEPESDPVKHNVPQLRSAVEAELVKCEKTVFISKTDEAWSEFSFLEKNYYWLKFTKGRDVLNPIPYGWIFENTGVSKIPRYFTFLLESGIHDRLEGEVQRRIYTNRKPAVEQKFDENFAMGLDTGITTLFELCAIIVGVSFSSMLGECRSYCGIIAVRGRKLFGVIFNWLGCK
ncbi:Glutamate receptor ionotropic, delta-1 [Folsomia candida]|uniref:Glutamate receptor ionotropic, delta-1 n=1 Tax=Folsomia candida TaxID=158441 RepID=A0A226D7M9_FOLCA|nr:Glutamate receptor ionotropic, delta-1 [Folsomia candida]